MTARYRCPFCGTGFMDPSTSRKHIFKAHRMLLIEGLGLIEAFGTRKDPIAPPRRLKDHLQANPGVSGEGDSS